MTQRTLSTSIFLVMFSFVSYTINASENSGKTETENSSSVVKAQTTSDFSGSDKKMPVFPAPQPKVPHGKMHTPQMEELPHIHKFHKERVKKIKKHHSKYWLLSKILIVLCHLSILVIAYLHATH